MAVGVMRLYPALNAAGLDFGTALILVVTQFPVTVFVLGTLAVLPSTFIGCKIKESMGLSLDSIVLVNLCNVLAVLWSAQAGRKLAFYVIDAAVATDPVQAAITTTIRLIVVLVFGLVAVGCGYALYTLYLSSPVFLCEFGQPTFLGVQISGLTEVRSQMWKAYDKYFRGLVSHVQLPSFARQTSGDVLATATATPQPASSGSSSGQMSFIGVLKDVLGMYVSLRNMFAGQDRLAIAAKFAVQVSNIEANRPLTLAGVRIVVTARKKRPQPAPSNGRLPVFVQPPSPMLQLVSLVLNPVNIPTGVTTLEMEAQIQVGTEALVALAKDTSPIEAMDIVLCVDSPMIDQVCFTMPLVSYSDGRWQHCFQAEDGSTVVSRWVSDRKRLQRASESLVKMLATWRRRPIGENTVLTSDAEGLLAILNRINPQQQPDQRDAPTSPKVSAASIDDLMQAAHFLVSIRLQEEQMQVGSADHRLSTACLLETGNAIMNLFYDAVLVDRLGGSHPIHTIIMSAIMAALQGLLSSDSPFPSNPSEAPSIGGLPDFPAVPTSEGNSDSEDPSGPPSPPPPEAPCEDPTIPDPVATSAQDGLDPLSVLAQQLSFSGRRSTDSNVFASSSESLGLFSNNRFAYMRPATQSNDLSTLFQDKGPVPGDSAIGQLFSSSNALAPSPTAPPASNYFSCRGGESGDGFVVLGREDVQSPQGSVAKARGPGRVDPETVTDSK